VDAPHLRSLSCQDNPQPGPDAPCRVLRAMNQHQGLPHSLKQGGVHCVPNRGNAGRTHRSRRWGESFGGGSEKPRVRCFPVQEALSEGPGLELKRGEASSLERHKTYCHLCGEGKA
jgi:hypothetical protein